MQFFREIPITIIRKHIRTLRLRIKEDGTVYLSVPLFVTNAEVERFLADKYDWMVRVRTHFLKQANDTQRLTYTTGDTILLFKKPYTLSVQPTRVGNSVTVEENLLILRCKESATPAFRKAIIENFLRKQLATVLEQMVTAWCERLHEAPVTFTIRDMRTEWGSCTPYRRTMRFNLKLVEKDLHSIEYVVVHELTHLRIANHGPAFKQYMTERLPDWQLRKKILNKH